MEILSQDTMSNYIYMHLYVHTTCIHGCACSAGLFIPGDRHALWQHVAAVLLLRDRRRMCARNAVLLLALSSTWYNTGVRIMSSWSLVSHRTEGNPLISCFGPGERSQTWTCFWAETENHHFPLLQLSISNQRGFGF